MDIQPFESRLHEPGIRLVAATPPAWMSAAAASRAVPLLPQRGTPCVAAQAAFRRIEDREFLQMSRVYGLHGGLASGDEVAWRMRRHWDQPISLVAKLIVRREVVSLVWRSQLLLPLFQFTMRDMRVLPVVRDVLCELTGVFDDWEIASWIARPNALLRNERPVDLVSIDDEGLVQAARTDRFVARG